MTLTPAEINATLDRRGLLDDASGAGTYALAVDTPDTVEGVARQWRESSDAALPEGYADQLTASAVAYVGYSSDVQARLAEHARGATRRASFLEAFRPRSVVGVWALQSETPGVEERNRARALSRDGFVVWCDGRLY